MRSLPLPGFATGIKFSYRKINDHIYYEEITNLVEPNLLLENRLK